MLLVVLNIELQTISFTTAYLQVELIVAFFVLLLFN